MGANLEAARAAYDAGDAEGAIRVAQTYLRRHREDGRGWELMGVIQYRLLRFAASVSALERASLFVPLQPAARVCLAHAYGKINRVALSRDLLVDLITDDSLSVPLLLQVAAGLDAIDEPGMAMSACRAAAVRDPDHPQSYYDLGYYAGRCGHAPHLAESLARKAIRLDPTNVCYRVGLATLLMKQDRVGEAYDVVSDFSNDQISLISCRSCLRRVTELFKSYGDARRVVLCHLQLLALDMHGQDSGHE